MNQTQRKYVTERVKTIFNTRKITVQNSFNSKPENIGVSTYTDHPNYPIYGEILKALAGFPSTAIITKKGKDLEKALSINSNRNDVYGEFVRPLNADKIESQKAELSAYQSRYKTEVTDRLKTLNDAYTQCMDLIVLGEHAEQITAAIAAFEALEI
jgi:hypothetical protein